MTEQIAQLDAWHVPVGLHRGHTMSFGTIEHADLVVVRATGDSGTTGWGEVTVLGGLTGRRRPRSLSSRCSTVTCSPG